MALLRDFATWRFEPAWAPWFARFPASTLLAGRAKNKIGARRRASKHRLDRAIGRRRGESRLAAAQVAWPVPARPPSSSSRMASPRGAALGGKVWGRGFAFRLFFLLSRPHLSPPSRFAFSPSLRFFFLFLLLHLVFFFSFCFFLCFFYRCLASFSFLLSFLLVLTVRLAPFFSAPAFLNGFDPCRLPCVSRTRRPIACRPRGEKKRRGQKARRWARRRGPSCAMRRARLDCGLLSEIKGALRLGFLRLAFWLSIVFFRALSAPGRGLRRGGGGRGWPRREAIAGRSEQRESRRYNFVFAAADPPRLGGCGAASKFASEA